MLGPVWWMLRFLLLGSLIKSKSYNLCMIRLKYTVLIPCLQFHTSHSMFFSSTRCVADAIIYIFLLFIPHRLCWSSPHLLCWPTLRSVVPGPGALCSWCSSVPAGEATGCCVPGKTGRSARQTSSSLIVQVPAWLTKGRAVSTHLLEHSPDARSVWIQLGLRYGRQTFKTCWGSSESIHASHNNRWYWNH